MCVYHMYFKMYCCTKKPLANNEYAGEQDRPTLFTTGGLLKGPIP